MIVSALHTLEFQYSDGACLLECGLVAYQKSYEVAQERVIENASFIIRLY